MLFTKRNELPHNRLNLLHPRKFGGRTDTALSDAIEDILATYKPIEIDQSVAEGRGEIRYLQKVLLACGILTQREAFSGNIGLYKLAPPENYKNLPALSDLIAKLRSIPDGGQIDVAELLDEFIQHPYGQGPIALSLFLATGFRYFRDELILKYSKDAFGSVNIRAASDIIDMVNREHPEAVIGRRSIGKNERELINEIVHLFSDNSESITEDHAVSEVHLLMEAWWEKRTNIQKAQNLYEKDSSSYQLVDNMARVKEYSPHDLVFTVIKEIYGVPQDAKLTKKQIGSIVKGLKSNKQLIEAKSRDIKDKLIKNLMHVFAPKSDQYRDYFEAVREWYSKLTDQQKDEHESWYLEHLGARTLMLAIRRMEDIEDTFFDQIPCGEGFDFRRVDDWRRDRTAEYKKKLGAALKFIEEHGITIPNPKFEIKGVDVVEVPGGHHVDFRGSVEVKLSPPSSGVTIRLINTDEDPRTARQFEEITKVQTIKIETSCILRFVCHNEQGDFGEVIQVQFVNVDDKYKIRKSFDLDDERWLFKFPPDVESAKIFFASAVETLVNNKVFSKELGQKLLELLENTN
jgi:hypothetical protein